MSPKIIHLSVLSYEYYVDLNLLDVSVFLKCSYLHK